MGVAVGSGKALNKIQWDKDGRKVAIGSSDARVHVYDVGEVSVGIRGVRELIDHDVQVT